MTNSEVVIGVSVLYALALFAIAYLAERDVVQKRFSILSSPLIYTLSLSVYCTAWTFYGAVGSAARNGFEFLAIYLGPTLIFVGWWWFLRRLVEVGRTEKLTSIADFVSARYGKSVSLAAIITIIALIGTTPYIALQLQSLTLSFSVFTHQEQLEPFSSHQNVTAFILAFGLAVFIALFGTRNLNASERHEGVVTAIALEAIVKLVALVTVGMAVLIWSLNPDIELINENVVKHMNANSVFSSRWVVLIMLSAFAIFSLPRMFQVLVVENQNEKQLALASWAFPAYLFLMCLFVMPITLFGLSQLSPNSNPDLFVLTIPLSQGYDSLAILAFLGGFSSATSMVIVAALALATMVSNHLILPLTLAMRTRFAGNPSSNLRGLTLASRRITIFIILALGYLYFQYTGGTDALASIGLIAFLGVSQIVPPLFGGMVWRKATKLGAISGVTTGFILWIYTSFLPSFGESFLFNSDIFEYGLFGLWILKPYALFGSDIPDPLVHSFIWSLGSNVAVFCIVSLLTTPSDQERVQFPIFQMNDARQSRKSLFDSGGSPFELLALSQRILGHSDGVAFFKQAALSQGLSSGLPTVTPAFLDGLEKEFASVVGAATAQAMLAQFVGSRTLSVSELIALADEQSALRAYSTALEEKSNALSESAAQLKLANIQLVHLGQQRDQFLTSVSHELRTPMTSIRSFAEILHSEFSDQHNRPAQFAKIIHDESLRLTKLLDEILEISFLESGQPTLHLSKISVQELLERACTSAASLIEERGAVIHYPDQNIDIITDADRLVQPFINLISNGIKHNPSEQPRIWLKLQIDDNSEMFRLIVEDNGAGIPHLSEFDIFEKFATASKGSQSGIGLGLPISAHITRLLGGTITAENTPHGARFILELPLIFQQQISQNIK